MPGLLAPLGGLSTLAPSIDFGAVPAQPVMPHAHAHAKPQQQQNDSEGKGDPGMLDERVCHFS
jgi:hypothetical protein